jgi:hypothetical protein
VWDNRPLGAELPDVEDPAGARSSDLAAAAVVLRPRSYRHARAGLAGALGGAAAVLLLGTCLWAFHLLPPSPATRVPLAVDGLPERVFDLELSTQQLDPEQVIRYAESGRAMYEWAYGGEGIGASYSDEAGSAVLQLTAVNGSLAPLVPTSQAELTDMIAGKAPAYPVVRLPGTDTARCSYQWFGSGDGSGEPVAPGTTTQQYLDQIAGGVMSGYLTCVRSDAWRGFAVSLTYSYSGYVGSDRLANEVSAELAAETDRVWQQLAG